MHKSCLVLTVLLALTCTTAHARTRGLADLLRDYKTLDAEVNHLQYAAMRIDPEQSAEALTYATLVATRYNGVAERIYRLERDVEHAIRKTPITRFGWKVGKTIKTRKRLKRLARTLVGMEAVCKMSELYLTLPTNETKLAVVRYRRFWDTCERALPLNRI